jgi:ATP-dependent protease HslVU (ClpYQ) peptidase subunit
MTTIVVVSAAEKNQGIILAADRQETMGDHHNGSHSKQDRQKLYTASSGDFAFGIAGTLDEAFWNFAGNLIDGKYNVEDIVKKGAFGEFKELNLNRWAGREPTEAYNKLLLVTRFNDLVRAYNCFPLGAVTPVSVDAIGSGARHAMDNYQQTD